MVDFSLLLLLLLCHLLFTFRRSKIILSLENQYEQRLITFILSTLFLQQSDSIVPVTSGEKGFRARILLSSDNDSSEPQTKSDSPETNLLSVLKSTKSNEDSLTFSEDSDTTRIYNLNTRETKIVAPSYDSPIESPVKLAQQFFRGAFKQTATIRKMDDEVTTVIRTSNRNLVNGGSVSSKFLMTQ